MVLALVPVTLLLPALLSVTTANYTDAPFIPCTELEIPNGKVSLEMSDVSFVQIATVRCLPSFDLYGPDKLACVSGNWQPTTRIFCTARCLSPPYIKDGSVEVEGEKAEGMFKRGSLAKYTCAPGYDLVPSESKFRECKEGVWIGTNGLCIAVRREGCKPPEPLKNGYYVHENIDKTGQYGIGGRLHYSCSNGYEMMGTPTQTCLDDGTWSPKIAPKCIPMQSEGLSCPPLPTVPYAKIRPYSVVSGSEVEVRCIESLFSVVVPCSRTSQLKCVDGNWIGTLPDCGSRDCPPPPEVLHATIYNLNMPRIDVPKSPHFVNAQVSYHCYPGYEIRGHEILTCTSGCWIPKDPPVCVSVEEAYLDTGSTSSRILASLASGVCVLLLLVVVCLVVICKKRKPLSRAVSIQPAVPRPDLGDHASLLHPPDRLALIAFADSIQTAPPVLPTYEEAIRDSRSSGFVAARIQRPHWPSLAARRPRNAPNPDNIHVTRQGSFASHSASLRSDPMGSTDTMAVSENSTTVTLETASSHSGSQPGSCRAHCGSLASFDTGSVLNTEGVPLLEENELEDVQGDSISLAMENRSMTDNSSFKLSTGSDIH